MSVSKSSLFLVPVLLVLMQSYEPILSKAGDTISAGQFLSGNQTIVSERNTFQLGFFKPGNYNMYLGISYKDHPGKKNDVWVANRDTPLSNQPSLRYGLSLDGNLVITQGSSVLKPVWSTNLTHSSLNSTEAIVFDSGNLVLRDKLNHSRIFWESFDHPIDVWLPGQKLRISKASDRLITSWKNQQDPTSGIFSLGIDQSNASSSIELYLQWNKSINYWRSGVWNGQYFKNARDMKASDVYNVTYISTENESYLTYGVSNPDILTKIYLGHRGKLKLHVWLDKHWNWKSLWQEPKSSSVYALCGAFGLFHEYDSELCECLQGFSPSSLEETRLNDWSNGCVRRYPLNCNISDHEAKDWFFRLQNVTLPANEKYFSAFNNASCEIACMRNCSCTAFVHNSSGCLIWDGVLLNLQQFSDGTARVQDIYLKLSAAEIQHTHDAKDNSNRKRVVETIVPVCIGALLLILSLCLVFIKVLKVKGESNEDLLSFDFNSDPQIADDEHDNQSQRKQDVELPAFSYKSVCATTDNFSEVNKLGEGGFGPVYKGKLANGHEIAVKRLSRCSVQGLEEFRNETKLIAKLQHRNLVRLLGCCIQLGEKILIYEYMPNGSLDSFLFDATKRQELDWGTRIGIIEGIAQGLLYLHQHSRLRIIHRDLKPSNILLDSEMNPKISDFGLARIFGGSEMQANTGRIVGTYGYMPPEYAMEGLFSIKSDVFSFGVLLLEIVSGKKNRSVYKELSLNLLGYAWELWTSDRGLDLLDPTLECPSSWNHAVPLRYINIGLLCVQEIPSDRPTMVDVVSMLTSVHEPLPNPKQPAFTKGGHSSKTSAASSSSFVPSDASLNYMTQSNFSSRHQRCLDSVSKPPSS